LYIQINSKSEIMKRLFGLLTAGIIFASCSVAKDTEELKSEEKPRCGDIILLLEPMMRIVLAYGDKDFSTGRHAYVDDYPPEEWERVKNCAGDYISKRSNGKYFLFEKKEIDERGAKIRYYTRIAK